MGTSIFRWMTDIGLLVPIHSTDFSAFKRCQKWASLLMHATRHDPPIFSKVTDDSAAQAFDTVVSLISMNMLEVQHERHQGF